MCIGRIYRNMWKCKNEAERSGSGGMIQSYGVERVEEFKGREEKRVHYRVQIVVLIF